MEFPGEDQTRLRRLQVLRRKISKTFFNANDPEQNDSRKESDPSSSGFDPPIHESDPMAVICVKVVGHELVQGENGLIQPVYTLQIKEDGKLKEQKFTTEDAFKLQGSEDMLRIYYPRLTQDIKPHMSSRSLAPGEEHTLRIKACAEGGMVEFLLDDNGTIILRGVDIIHT
ncbi:hypothetical protein N7540_013216 [Penicillium herquei]|nr:hypothetical protein N7540_013216 [Penicillium herquei]